MTKIETYSDVVKKNIENYNGQFADIIKYAPIFYELFESLIKEISIKGNVRSIINSVIAYFVLPSDIIPEDEYGAFGYIDDLYLCVYVISLLDKEKDVIIEHWKYDENVIKLALKLKEEIENIDEEIITKEELQLIKDYIKPTVREYGLYQDVISPHLLLHISKIAKENSLLDGKTRHLLYKFSTLKMKGITLSSKQSIFFENIIQRAIDEGVFQYDCGKYPCFKCDKLKEMKIKKNK